jgi:hypothetical protein
MKCLEACPRSEVVWRQDVYRDTVAKKFMPEALSARSGHLEPTRTKVFSQDPRPGWLLSDIDKHVAIAACAWWPAFCAPRM